MLSKTGFHTYTEPKIGTASSFGGAIPSPVILATFDRITQTQTVFCFRCRDEQGMSIQPSIHRTKYNDANLNKFYSEVSLSTLVSWFYIQNISPRFRRSETAKSISTIWWQLVHDANRHIIWNAQNELHSKQVQHRSSRPYIPRKHCLRDI